MAKYFSADEIAHLNNDVGAPRLGDYEINEVYARNPFVMSGRPGDAMIRTIDGWIVGAKAALLADNRGSKPALVRKAATRVIEPF